jgi:hypothetical protein
MNAKSRFVTNLIPIASVDCLEFSSHDSFLSNSWNSERSWVRLLEHRCRKEEKYKHINLIYSFVLHMITSKAKLNIYYMPSLQTNKKCFFLFFLRNKKKFFFL